MVVIHYRHKLPRRQESYDPTIICFTLPRYRRYRTHETNQGSHRTKKRPRRNNLWSRMGQKVELATNSFEAFEVLGDASKGAPALL